MAAHTIMERCFMRMGYLPGIQAAHYLLRALGAAMDTHPMNVEEQQGGDKQWRFWLAIPQAIFAYPLPKYLEKALTHWRIR